MKKPTSIFTLSMEKPRPPLVVFCIRITSATGMTAADAEIEEHTYDPERRSCDGLGSGHRRLLGGARMGDLVGNLVGNLKLMSASGFVGAPFLRGQ